MLHWDMGSNIHTMISTGFMLPTFTSLFKRNKKRSQGGGMSIQRDANTCGNCCC